MAPSRAYSEKCASLRTAWLLMTTEPENSASKIVCIHSRTAPLCEADSCEFFRELENIHRSKAAVKRVSTAQSAFRFPLIAASFRPPDKSKIAAEKFFDGFFPPYLHGASSRIRRIFSCICPNLSDSPAASIASFASI